MKIVVLCGREPRHLHVANRLCRAGNVVAVVHETTRHWSWRKLRRTLNPVRLGRKLRWWILSGGHDPEEARFFFGTRRPALDHPELGVRVPHVNHPDVLALVEREGPDVVAVYGTGVIRRPLLGRGRIGMINLHPGLAPHYRGVDSTFWALHDGRPEQVACTLHFIDDGIDTGALLAHVYPEVTPEDDDRTLFRKVVRDGAEAYADLLARLDRGERLGRPQTERGRLYQARDRTRAHDRELRARLASGLLTGRNLSPRITWFRPDAGWVPEHPSELTRS